MRLWLLTFAIVTACSGDDATTPVGDGETMELPAGRYESEGGRGKDAAVEILPDESGDAGLFFAELHDFCFAQRCVQGLTACGRYHLDGLRLRFLVDEYRRADGSPETAPHRMSAAYQVAPAGDGTIHMIELDDEEHPMPGAEQVIHYVGEATRDVASACAIRI